MRPDIVVDVGNSFIKWGRCAGAAVVERVFLPHADSGAWRRQLDAWGLNPPLRWVVTGVRPSASEALVHWLRQRGDAVDAIELARQLPLTVRLEKPDAVGIDRLLSAVAANTRRAPETPAVVVGAGTAITVDWLDGAGAFCGGAILPGFRLMAHALHDHTALLPLVEVGQSAPALPGTATTAAMQAGIYWASAGGTRAVIEELLRAAAAQRRSPVPVFLTGGDAPLLEAALKAWLSEPARSAVLVPWPLMTLEGIRLAAEALP